MHKIVKLFLALFIFTLTSTLLTSCDSSGVYDEYYSINTNGWAKSDKQHFNVNVSDSLQAYNFIFNIRNNNEYPYRNAFFFINTYFPDSTFSRDTIEVILADKKGKWLGDGFGAIKTGHFMLQQGIRFPQSGKYIFEITHGMRTDTLMGIEDIGIRIEKFD